MEETTQTTAPEATETVIDQNVDLNSDTKEAPKETEVAAKAGDDPSKESPDPKASAKKTYKVKVYGEEKEVSEDDLINGYSKAMGAEQAFYQAAQEKKMVRDFLTKLQSDPIAVLSDPRLNIDLRKHAEQYLYNIIQEESMDPKEREALETKRQLEAYKRQVEEIKKQEQAQKTQKLVQEHQSRYEREIIKTLETSGLPKNERTVSRMAYYLSQAVKKGIDVPMKNIADLVREDYVNDIKSLVGSASGEELFKLLGEDTAKKVREFDLSRIKAPESLPKTPVSTQPSSQKQKKESLEAYTRRMNRELR